MQLTKQVLLDIEQERINQVCKWGKQNHSLEKWFVILSEEVGEVAQAIQSDDDWRKESDKSNIYEELIQVAAVAVSIAEQIKEASVIHHEETNVTGCYTSPTKTRS
ncbi:MazG-like family protein [Bacillus massiliigorillae]|uniref:MazG-like family protein n=1 Tax=Bacillus massiliigorillae TaxID=1243664 RepID=UPI00039AE1BD|nr:MazG-like family protein [Bacillus massiliigorillae]